MNGRLESGQRKAGGSKSWALVLLPYIVLGLLVPPVGETPYSDDFDYAATAWHLSDTGRLCLSDWPAMTLAGHAAWGALFCKLGGNSYLMLRLSMFTLSALAAVALWAWARRHGHSDSFACWCGVTLAVCPVVVSLEYSFLTDMTGAALATLLVVLSRSMAVEGSNWHLLAYSALGGIAYLCRQTACIPYLVVMATFGWDALRRRTGFAALVPLTLPFVVLVIGYRQWVAYVHGIPSNQALLFLQLRPLIEFGERISTIIATLGLQLFPIAVFVTAVALRSRWSGFWRKSAVVALLILALSRLTTGSFPIACRGELFDIGLRSAEMPGSGAPESLRGPRFALGDSRISIVQSLASLLSTFAAATLIVYSLRTRKAGLAWQGAPGWAPTVSKLSFLITAGLLLFTPSFMDRYIVSLVPLALLILAEVMPPAESGQPRVQSTAWAVTLATGLISLVGIQDGMQRSRAFWGTASELHARGLTPRQIDGGLAYAGFYRFNTLYRGPNNDGPSLDKLPPKTRSYIIAEFSPLSISDHRPIQISFDEDPAYHIAARQPFQSWFRTGHVLILLRRDVPLQSLPKEVQTWLQAHNGK